MTVVCIAWVSMADAGFVLSSCRQENSRPTEWQAVHRGRLEQREQARPRGWVPVLQGELSSCFHTAFSITQKCAWCRYMHTPCDDGQRACLMAHSALCRLKQRRQGGSSAGRKVCRWCASTPPLCLGLWWGSVLMPRPSMTSRCAHQGPDHFLRRCLPALLPLLYRLCWCELHLLSRPVVNGLDVAGVH